MERIGPISGEIREKTVLVTARIGVSVRAEIKRRGYSIADMIRRGVQSIDAFPRLADRIAALEDNNGRLQKKLTDYAIKSDRLEEQLKGLGYRSGRV